MALGKNGFLLHNQRVRNWLQKRADNGQLAPEVATAVSRGSEVRRAGAKSRIGFWGAIVALMPGPDQVLIASWSQ